MLAASRALVRRAVPAINSVGGARHFSIISPDPGYSNLTLGPYPKTKEERIRAAKKYNLIPEDYEPYDEGEAYGDYPNLPMIGEANRDPYDDYDSPDQWRFYGEPYNAYHDLLTYERYDPRHKEKALFPRWFVWAWMLTVPLVLPTIYYVMQEFRINLNHPYKQRAMFPDQKLYEFPKSDSGHDHHH